MYFPLLRTCKYVFAVQIKQLYQVVFCPQVVDKRTLRVNNKRPAILSLRLTVPFVCPSLSPTCPLYLYVHSPTSKTTRQCFVSHLAVVQGKTALNCGEFFRNDDVGLLKNITVSSIFGDRSFVDIQEYNIVLGTTMFSSHKMASFYKLDEIRVSLEMSKW